MSVPPPDLRPSLASGGTSSTDVSASATAATGAGEPERACMAQDAHASADDSAMDVEEEEGGTADAKEKEVGVGVEAGRASLPQDVVWIHSALIAAPAGLQEVMLNAKMARTCGVSLLEAAVRSGFDSIESMLRAVPGLQARTVNGVAMYRALRL